jgi:integrase
MNAYAAAHSTKDTTQKLRGEAGTFNRLIAEYQQSVRYKKLKPKTEKVYRNIFAKFAESHGHRIVEQMTSKHFEKILSSMSDTPGAANSFLKRFRTMMRYAHSKDWISRDPTFGQIGFDGGHIHTWTDEEIGQYEKYWAIGTKERTAFALHLFTAQRRSDVHRMQWPDIVGGAIKVAQVKTGEHLQIPFHPELAHILSKTEKSHFAIIPTKFGKPYTAESYGAWINEAIKQAGLPERCVAHGLRCVAACRLAESGCTLKEIMAVTGHQTMGMVALYTKHADQKSNAIKAMQKLIANTKWQTEVA